MPSNTPNNEATRLGGQAGRVEVPNDQVGDLIMSSTTDSDRPAAKPATERPFECLRGCIEHDGSTRYPDPACWSEQPAGWSPTSLSAEPVRLMAIGRQSDSGVLAAEVIVFIGNPGEDEGDRHAEMSTKQARWLAARLVEAADLADSMVQVDA